MYAWKMGKLWNICIFTGEDPTYRVIENGEWHSDRSPTA